jgi:hypothetical protein
MLATEKCEMGNRVWLNSFITDFTILSSRCYGKVVPVYAMKAYRGAEVQNHPFLTLELGGVK